MTLENLMSQMGIGTKQLSERYSEYPAPSHDQHAYYPYEPSAHSHGHVASSKHNYGGSHKSNAAMSALTLLAFLFFLHILQQCVKDHINDMGNTPVMIMTAGREGEDDISKSTVTGKIDKTGVTQSSKRNTEKNKAVIDKYEVEYPSGTEGFKNDLIKVEAAEHIPQTDAQNFKYVYKSYANRSSAFPGFFSTMNDEK